MRKPEDRANLIAYLQTLQPEDEIGKLGPQDDAAPAEEGAEEAAPADDGEAAPATEEAPAEETPAEEAPADASTETTSG